MLKFLKFQSQGALSGAKRISLQLTDNQINTYAKAFLFVFILFAANYALAQGADASTQLSPMLDKILNSLSGTLGKVIMAVGLLLSVLGAVAGMNKAVILTPVGIGFLLGNAKTIIDWMFA